MRGKMSKLTCAMLDHRAWLRHGKGALLASVVALTLTGAPLQSAYAEGSASDVLGTPQDLPITLSGSYLSGLFSAQNNDFAEAAAIYEEALAADPNNSDLAEQTFLLNLANGNITESLVFAQDLRTSKIRNYIAELLLASNMAKGTNFTEAEKVLKPGNGGPLGDLTTGIARAWLLFGQKKTDAALKSLDDLKGPDWFTPFVAAHAALIADAGGRKDLALKKIEQAYNLDRGSLKVVDAYARILARNGDKAKALDILAQYEKMVPDHPLLSATRRAIESKKRIPAVMSSPTKGIAEMLNGLGSAIAQDGSQDLAACYLQLSLYLDPKAEYSAIALGSLYQQLEKPAKAIEYLKKVPASSALKRDAEIQIGLNYNAMDKPKEAQQHLEVLIRKDPSDLEAVTALGNVQRSHKLFKEAEATYSKGIATLKKPTADNWTLYYYRGISRERLGKWDLAEADLRQALKLHPDQPMVLNYLGYSLVDRGIKFDEALNMIKRAVTLRPSDGYIVDSLGWVYYRLGRYDEAVNELEHAIDLKPADPVINDHLGDAYWRVGRHLDAKFQWNHARDLGPEKEELPKILEKIKNGLPDVPATTVSDDKTGSGKPAPATAPSSTSNGG